MRSITFLIVCTLLLIAPAASQSGDGIQGSSILLEAAKILGFSQEVTKDRNITEAKRAEYFANVSSVRKQIVRILPELKAKIADLDKERTDLQEKIDELEESISEMNKLREKDRDELQQTVTSRTTLAQQTNA